MSTRRPIPYTPVDSLIVGDELRIKRIGCLPVIGCFDGFHLDGDGTFWLKLRTTTTLLWVMPSAIQRRDGELMIQRLKSVVDAKHWDERVWESVMHGEGRVV